VSIAVGGTKTLERDAGISIGHRKTLVRITAQTIPAPPVVNSPRTSAVVVDAALNGRTDETSADGGLSAVAATRLGLPLPAAGQQLHGLQRSGMVRRHLFLGPAIPAR
jgi:hypothetical protein